MKYILFSFFMVFTMISCTKSRNGNNNGIPLVSVDIYVYANDPEFFKLNPIGGWEYISGGSKGIIVYRKSESEFAAYDRHCTYKPNNSCSKVSVDSSDIAAIDTCCTSRFLLTDGSVIEGPATYALKQYQTSYDGSVLRIFN